VTVKRGDRDANRRMRGHACDRDLGRVRVTAVYSAEAESMGRRNIWGVEGCDGFERASAGDPCDAWSDAVASWFVDIEALKARSHAPIVLDGCTLRLSTGSPAASSSASHDCSEAKQCGGTRRRDRLSELRDNHEADKQGTTEPPLVAVAWPPKASCEIAGPPVRNRRSPQPQRPATHPAFGWGLA
jgi:hypothetical protein